MRLAFPVDFAGADHSNIRLIDQRCRLKRMPGRFTPQQTLGQLVQLVEHQRHQMVGCVLLAVYNLGQQLGHSSLIWVKVHPFLAINSGFFGIRPADSSAVRRLIV